MKSFRSILFAPLLILAACPANPCKSGSDPQVVVGQGEFEYAPLGDEIELIHGQQGGYHLLVALQARFFKGDELMTATMTASVGGEEKGRQAPWLDMQCTDDALESWGTFLIFEDEVLPEDLVGETVVIDVVLTDIEGLSGSGQGEVTIIDTVDENPEEEEPPP